jgi:hypothetical protein
MCVVMFVLQCDQSAQTELHEELALDVEPGRLRSLVRMCISDAEYVLTATA